MLPLLFPREDFFIAAVIRLGFLFGDTVLGGQRELGLLLKKP